MKDNQFSPTPPTSFEVVQRGDLQSPHIGDGAGHFIQRIRQITIKIVPTADQYQRICDLAWQAARYKNNFIFAKLIQARDYRLNDSNDKNSIEKKIRKTEKNELSAATYVAAETDAKAAWTRNAKRILAGGLLPQWRSADSLAIHGHRSKTDSGVRIERMNDAYCADLALQSAKCEGGCWFRVAIPPHTERDRYIAPILDGMVTGAIPIKIARIIIKKRRHRMLLQLIYPVEIYMPAMGERSAMLFEMNDRVTLRCENDNTTITDYTSKLTHLLKMKEHFDGLLRRFRWQIGKRKNGNRAKKTKFEYYDFDQWQKDFLHKWSADVVRTLTARGINKLNIMLIGGDWAADKFKFFLSYKLEAAGIYCTDVPSIQDEPTERTLKNTINKNRSRAKKIGEATRTISATLTTK